MDELKNRVCVCLPLGAIQKGKDDAKKLGLSFSAYISYLISKQKVKE